jgi:hypothetical protein
MENRMSNTAALALVVASFFPGAFLVFYMSKMANDVGNELVAGVIRGNPMPIKHRWLVLYQTWLGYVSGTVGACVLAAAVNVQIAIQATDRGVETVAYLAAFFGGLASLSWLLASVTEFLCYRSVLRQAEAD